MKKILIVEDEQDMVDMISMRLEALGHTILTASNGKEGLQLARMKAPDLIISDVLMPVMDGFAMYKELKKTPVTADIPVLILTARGKMEDAFMVVGADDFIVKPFETEDFLKKVNRLLNKDKIVSAGQTRSHGQRVLVAGSDNETVERMAMILKNAEYHVDFVTSGAQVITKAVLFLPHILILDVLMDGMQSRQIIDVLRKMSQFEKIPILTYSFYRLEDLGSEDVRQRALSVDSSQENCAQAGATHYIGRFKEAVFLQTIQPYLAQS